MFIQQQEYTEPVIETRDIQDKYSDL
jgi:hypothetical protein